MNLHKLKQKIARKISGKQTNHFTSDEWQSRKDEIARKQPVKKIKVTDDKGKEHKVGEIFESETVTLEL